MLAHELGHAIDANRHEYAYEANPDRMPAFRITTDLTLTLEVITKVKCPQTFGPVAH